MSREARGDKGDTWWYWHKLEGELQINWYTISDCVLIKHREQRNINIFSWNWHNCTAGRYVNITLLHFTPRWWFNRGAWEPIHVKYARIHKALQLGGKLWKFSNAQVPIDVDLNSAKLKRQWSTYQYEYLHCSSTLSVSAWVSLRRQMNSVAVKFCSCVTSFRLYPLEFQKLEFM